MIFYNRNYHFDYLVRVIFNVTSFLNCKIHPFKTYSLQLLIFFHL